MLLWHFCSRFKFRGCFTILSLSYYSFSTVGYSNLGFLKFCAVILIINLCYTDPFGSFFFTFLSQPHLMQYQYITHFLIPRLIFLLVQRRHNGFFCFFLLLLFLSYLLHGGVGPFTTFLNFFIHLLAQRYFQQSLIFNALPRAVLSAGLLTPVVWWASTNF